MTRTDNILNIYKFSLVLILLSFTLQVINAQPSSEFEKLNNSFVWTHGKLYPYDKVHGKEKVLIPLAEARLSFEEEMRNILGRKLFPPKFDIPLKLKEGIDDYGFFTISAYFDHDQNYPNQLMDYSCGDLTYDFSNGFNHSGTDFFVWPFPWKKMYEEEVEVVAAAPGVLYWKQDGHYDQHCEHNEEPWNGVAILHEDGSTSWYIHLKKNSLTEKFVGEEITKGEYLGIVGSSGSSLAPHLHLEVYDVEGNLVDPFYGDCNTEIGSSWWSNQIAYKEPAIQKITTNHSLPVFPECPVEEIPNEGDEFYPGDTVFLLNYFKNISNNDVVEVSILRPDNSLFYAWDWNSPWPFYSASWLYFYIIINEDNFGDWKYRVTYAGVDYETGFELRQPQSIQDVSLIGGMQAYPNPVSGALSIIFTGRKSGKINFALYDLTGKKLLENTQQPILEGKFNVDMSAVETGIYFLEVSQDNSFSRLKVVKN